jgi:CheY-like chemotaxis protein
MPYYPTGINPQFLAMEGARLKDESDYFIASGAKEKPTDSGLAKQAAAPKIAEPPKPAPTPPAAPAPEPVPAAAKPAPAPVERAAPVAVAAPQPAKTGQPLLVVIDNDAVALKNIEVALQAKGFEVASFSRVEAGVKAARELLRKGRSLVVLADLVMPKRDGSGMLGGLEVLELLRAEEQHVPIAILADLQNPEAEKKAQELETDGYLAKPGRKFFVKEGDNTFAEFTGFVQSVIDVVAKLSPKASQISASKIADPFVDLSRELHGELEAATSHVSANAPMGGAGVQEKSRGLDLLKEMVRELNDPHFNADVSLLVLRFAVELMSRAVIFVIAGNEAIGLGQAGVEKSDATIAVKKMRIPLNESSIFADVLKTKAVVRRRLDSSKWNLKLLETLGGAEPTESCGAPGF